MYALTFFGWVLISLTILHLLVWIHCFRIHFWNKFTEEKYNNNVKEINTLNDNDNDKGNELNRNK